jgi:hypothetical protein
MSSSEKDRHRPWLAYALEESLERSLLAPRDVIDHANPEVLVTQLPPAVISELLSRALQMGTFSPAVVLESAPPALLAEHLNPTVMWRCLKEAADRGGLSRKGGARNPSARQWFTSILSRALESELIAPADVVRFLPPSEFVAEAPKPVVAKLIETALSRGAFDATLVLEHITPSVIAENLETSFVWDCIAEAAAKHFDLDTSPAPARASTSPMPVAAAVTAPVAAIAPKAAKPIEREKPAMDRKTAADKAAIAAAITGGAAMSRPVGSNPTTARGIPVPTNLAPAPATAPTPAAVAAAAAAAAAVPRREAIEWDPADDLDVLDDQPVPFTR